MTREIINRIVIIGLGSIGKRHLGLVQTINPSTEIRILTNTERKSFSDSSELIYSNIDEVLKFHPQVAIIANPAPFHIDMAQKLAEAGVSLLIEKPISTSTEGILKLIETCQKNKLVLLVGYNLRYLLSLQYFKKIIEEETIGKILAIRCEAGQYLPDWRPGKDYRESVSARKDLGGGVLLELSHEIDYLRWIFGEVNWVRAKLSKQSTLEIDVEDSASVVMGFKSNDHQQELLCSLDLDFIRHDQTRKCVAIGEKGSLRWDGVGNTVDLYSKGSNAWKNIFKGEDGISKTYEKQWKHFLDCVSRGIRPQVTGEDGLRVLEIIEAIRQSDTEGKEVAVVITRPRDNLIT
jgi:predicted dehydrogenase